MAFELRSHLLSRTVGGAIGMTSDNQGTLAGLVFRQPIGIPTQCKRSSTPRASSCIVVTGQSAQSCAPVVAVVVFPWHLIPKARDPEVAVFNQGNVLFASCKDPSPFSRPI